MTWNRALPLLSLAIASASFSSCAPNGFPDATTLQSVRILAASADPPYARPGATVSLQVLAYDARPVKAEPMTVYWLPFVCENPTDDAYYGCFARLAGAGKAGGATDGGAVPDAGTPGASGGAGGLPLGVDLTPFLPKGPSYQFVMPGDVIASHDTASGAFSPYGMVILFNLACAGHLELVPLDPGNVQAPPIGCFDTQHNRLGADDYVFGFTRVYSYDQVTNANPVIASIDIDGMTTTMNPDGTWPTLSKPHCTGSCPTVHVGPVVPPSSQEPDPSQKDPNGNAVKEVIWAEFFSTVGSWKDDARLLYDARNGSVGAPSKTDNEFSVPSVPGDGFVWIIVHDNRGGAVWATLPVHTL